VLVDIARLEDNQPTRTALIGHVSTADRAEGRPWAAIANTMITEGWPTATGGRWHPTTVRRIALSAVTTNTTSANDDGSDRTPHMRIAGTA